MNKKMTSMERILSTAAFKEPDRVPYLLLPTLHGAKELNMSIREYFSESRNVAEGQIRLQKKYGYDCLNPFFYASLETEARGGTVIYSDNGPPQAGAPFIRSLQDIKSMVPLKISQSDPLKKMLDTIKRLKDYSGGTIPIPGTVVSPYSVPVMQMGFERYADLMYDSPEAVEQLIAVNLDFAIQWGQAQIEAGADFLTYFDPFASPSVSPRMFLEKWGFKAASDLIAAVSTPVVYHLASGIVRPVLDLIKKSGAAGVGFSAEDDIAEIKRECQNELILIGNLNGVQMRNWSRDTVESIVKNLIETAAPGGGFILCDNHGEIPFQVSDQVLLTISEAVRRWGTYPVNTKTENHG